MSVVIGSADKFRNNRPLMVNAWSQTTGTDFSYLHEIENREQQSQRERELEEKIRVLEENLKAHTELLSQIHATSARTSALLSQQQPQSQPINNIDYKNNSNSSANISGNSTRAIEVSPKIVTAQNDTHQVNCAPAECIKYTILAEGKVNDNDEPIEIHLAEDSVLNSSAESGRLEICLDTEENIEDNNTTTLHHQMAPTTSNTTQQNDTKNETIIFTNNIQQKLPTQKRRIVYGNSLRKTAKVRITNVNTTTIQNVIPSLTDSSNADTSIITFDPENVMVSIGPNDTRIPAKLYDNMNWTFASIATRRLLMAIFDRKVLATHSMTGKPSPAFKDQGKPLKQMLDPLVIADIIFAVTRKCQVSDKEVRNAITTKCADENKMMKLQMNKRTPMREINKENLTG
ncbi:protein insensitive-like [Calliphora vicina]|uniref:protein insensitive-like n=1 Tax=Calliphora vicina TaxID=7373 RepID=UPI00325AEBB5